MRSAMRATTLLFSSLVFFGSQAAQATVATCSTTGCLTIRLQGDIGTLNSPTNITRNLNDTVMLEFVVDTKQVTFEGYGHDVTITPSMVSNITFTHETVTDNSKTLTDDLLGAFTLVPNSGGVSNVNQFLNSPGAGLLDADGIYVVDTMSFVLSQLGNVSVTAAFSAVLDAYGLNQVPTNNISFFGTNITVVPEPGTGLLLATGLLGFGALERRRRHA